MGIDLTVIPACPCSVRFLQTLTRLVRADLGRRIGYMMSFITMRNSTASVETAGRGGGQHEEHDVRHAYFFHRHRLQCSGGGVGIYWFLQQLVRFAGAFLLNKFYNPKEMAEKARVELERAPGKGTSGAHRAKEAGQSGALEERAFVRKSKAARRLPGPQRMAEKLAEDYTEDADTQDS